MSANRRYSTRSKPKPPNAPKPKPPNAPRTPQPSRGNTRLVSARLYDLLDDLNALTDAMATRYEVEREVTASEAAAARGNKRLKELDRQVQQLHASLRRRLVHEKLRRANLQLNLR